MRSNEERGWSIELSEKDTMATLNFNFTQINFHSSKGASNILQSDMVKMYKGIALIQETCIP